MKNYKEPINLTLRQCELLESLLDSWDDLMTAHDLTDQNCSDVFRFSALLGAKVSVAKDKLQKRHKIDAQLKRAKDSLKKQSSKHWQGGDK